MSNKFFKISNKQRNHRLLIVISFHRSSDAIRMMSVMQSLMSLTLTPTAQLTAMSFFVAWRSAPLVILIQKLDFVSISMTNQGMDFSRLVFHPSSSSFFFFFFFFPLSFVLVLVLDLVLDLVLVLVLVLVLFFIRFINNSVCIFFLFDMLLCSCSSCLFLLVLFFIFFIFFLLSALSSRSFSSQQPFHRSHCLRLLEDPWMLLLNSPKQIVEKDQTDPWRG